MPSWPPPPTREEPWHTQHLPVDGAAPQPVTVREVFLWGQEVLIDETERAIWCSRCCHFVPVAAMGPRGHHDFDARPPRGIFAPATCRPPGDAT